MDLDRPISRLKRSFLASAADIVFGMEDGAVSIFGLVFGVAATTSNGGSILIDGASLGRRRRRGLHDGRRLSAGGDQPRLGRATSSAIAERHRRRSVPDRRRLARQTGPRRAGPGGDIGARRRRVAGRGRHPRPRRADASAARREGAESARTIVVDARRGLLLRRRADSAVRVRAGDRGPLRLVGGRLRLVGRARRRPGAATCARSPRPSRSASSPRWRASASACSSATSSRTPSAGRRRAHRPMRRR